MSLFDRDSEESTAKDSTTPARRFTDRGGVETVLAVEALFEGKITGKTNVEVRGVLNGTCEIEGLAVVAESGSVTGDLIATDVVVEGQVQGNLVASNKMELRAKAKIEGDVRSAVLAMAEGCVINGKIEITGRASGAPGAPSSSTFSEKRES